MNRAEYLSRIGINGGEISPNEASLRSMQRAHLLAVPFENLDIHWNRPIVLDTEQFYRKIVKKKRGGFCYELNGLFNELLLHLGYTTRLVSAKVFNPAKEEYGPEFDHMIVLVSVDGREYITDVGFGDFSAEPLMLTPFIKQEDREGTFVVEPAEGEWFRIVKKKDDAWVPECMFENKGRELSEFAEMCEFQQYSPESHFKKGKICSLLTERGRKTLTDKSFIVTMNGKKAETPVRSDEEFDRLLIDEFRISKS